MLQIDAIVHGRNPIIDARGRGRPADDHGLGIGGANAGCPGGQQLNKSGPGQGRSLPLPLQVGLVPQFIGRHLTLVTASDKGGKRLKMGRVGRRPICLSGRPAPVRRLSQTEQQLDTVVLHRDHQMIQFGQ